MFENYIATKIDLEIITETLAFLSKNELDFIFVKRELLQDTSIVTYDSKYMYVIDLKGNIEKKEHSTTILENDLLGWRACVSIEGIKNKLQANNKNYISGPCLTPFNKLHSQRKNSIYTTPESYMATVIHEFGHVYYESIKKSWFSNYGYNIKVLQTAKSLYQNNKLNLDELQIILPQHPVETEIFAYCTDYSTASLFWSEYKKSLDMDYLRIVNKYLEREISDKLASEESVLDDTHIGACVLGKIILEKYGNTWVNFILNKN